MPIRSSSIFGLRRLRGDDDQMCQHVVHEDVEQVAFVLLDGIALVNEQRPATKEIAVVEAIGGSSFEEIVL